MLATVGQSLEQAAERMGCCEVSRVGPTRPGPPCSHLPRYGDHQGSVGEFVRAPCCVVGKAVSEMKVYSFELWQLSDEHLAWVAGECRKHLNESPAFLGSLGSAVLDERQRRLQRPDDPPTEFSVPLIIDYGQQYCVATKFVAFAMQAAIEQADWILRNFWYTIQEILFDQADQAVFEALASGAEEGAHCH